MSSRMDPRPTLSRLAEEDPFLPLPRSGGGPGWGWCRRSDRPLALHRGADQVAPLVLEVVDAAMQDEAVVPHEQRVRLPAHPALVLQPMRQGLQVVEQRPALLFAPADEALEIGALHVERFAAGAGMRADRGMDALQLILGITVRLAEPEALALFELRVLRPDVLAGIDDLQPAEHLLHALRQLLVDEEQVGEGGIAAIARHVEGAHHDAERRTLEER